MKELISPEIQSMVDPWSAIESSWKNVNIKNKRPLNQNKIDVCLVLCPLYQVGPLSDSKLIKSPSTIEDSRVASKISAYLGVLETLVESIKPSGKEIDINFIVANKGILFKGEPDQDEYNAIQYHNILYRNLIENFCHKHDLCFNFQDYQSTDIDFPTFVDLDNPIPKDLKSETDQANSDEYLLIEYLNKYLRLPESIINNKKTRHVIKNVLHINGMNLDSAFWLIAGYLVFDYKINELVNDNGIYLTAERIEQLFGISKLTPSLSKLITIQIKA